MKTNDMNQNYANEEIKCRINQGMLATIQFTIFIICLLSKNVINVYRWYRKS
jgi:hypothetical protein